MAWLRVALALALLGPLGAGAAERCGVERPPALWGSALVYDAERDRIVLFGGAVAPREFSGDTWTWSPAGWRCHDVPGPSARGFSGAAFDPERGRVVLQGGRGEGNATLGDTWDDPRRC